MKINLLSLLLLCIILSASCDTSKNKAMNDTEGEHPAYTNPVVLPYSEQIADNPDDATAYFTRSKALVNIGQDSLAILDLKKALELVPHNVDYLVAIAYLFDKNGQYRQAVDYYKKAQQLVPENDKIKLAYITALIHHQDLNTAKPMIDALSKRNPGVPAVAMAYAQYFLTAKDTTAALDTLMQVLKTEPNHYDALSYLADIYFYKNDVKSVTYYQKMMDLDSLEIYPLERIGDYYYKNGNTDEAAKHYKKAIFKDKYYEMAYLKLADIFFEKRDYEAAIRHYRLAIAVSPALIGAYSGLAQAYEASKLYDSASRYYGITLNFEKNNPEAIAGIKRLRAIKKTQ